MRKERTPIIAANWKMHNGPQQACSYIQALLSALPQAKRCGIVLCLPYVDLAAAAPLLRDTRMALGAQNIHWAPQGAYTGEISASMLTQLEVRYVIVGHSERRRLFGESDQDVNQKLRAALDAGLRPILCVGEDLEQRQLGAAMELIAYQLKTALSGVSAQELRQVIIAYEPIWAIGTGVSATPEQAGEVCTGIRQAIQQLYGAPAAQSVIIQYGGSMNEGNAAQLLSQEDIDGGLIGTASLDLDKFLSIVQTDNQLCLEQQA